MTNGGTQIIGHPQWKGHLLFNKCERETVYMY